LREKSFLFGFLTAFLLVLTRSGGYILLYIFFGLILLLSPFYKEKFHQKRLKKSWFSSTLILFGIVLIAIPFSETFYDNIKVLGRVFTFILVPAGFLFLPRSVGVNYKKGLLKGLIAGGIFTSLLLLINNFIKYFYRNDEYSMFSYYYTYHEFAGIINKHPTFLGMEILFGLVLLLFSLEKETDKKKMGWMTAGGFLMIATLIFINSRAIIFLLSLVLLIFFFQKIFQLIKNRKFQYVLILMISGITLGWGIFRYTQNTYFFERYSKELKWDLTYQSGTSIFFEDQRDSRFARWNSALEVISKKLWTGHGNNSEVRELVKQYEADNLKYALEKKYHSHNIYLSYLIEYGIWGLTLLLLFLVSNLVLAFQIRDWKWFILVGFICFISLFDIYLSRSGGVLMSTLFINSFLFFRNNIH